MDVCVLLQIYLTHRNLSYGGNRSSSRGRRGASLENWGEERRHAGRRGEWHVGVGRGKKLGVREDFFNTHSNWGNFFSLWLVVVMTTMMMRSGFGWCEFGFGLSCFDSFGIGSDRGKGLVVV